MDKVKRNIRSWLQIQEAVPSQIFLQESLNYEGNAIKNRIWYRGDGNELSQLYKQLIGANDNTRFWASSCSPGMEMRKIHTGLPSLMVNVMTNVCLEDIREFEIKENADKELWRVIEKDNNFRDDLEEVVKECLYIGDGAYKISFDTSISKYPIIEFFAGDEIEIISKRKRIKEIVFMTNYSHKNKTYTLRETYGYGYIKNTLWCGDKEVPIDSIPQTMGIKDFGFGGYKEREDGTEELGSYILAIPLRFFGSSKWKGRGESIFDRKADAFDSFDEAWSQWMDALRAGRSKEYIPESLIPRDPQTGGLLKPNAFDNRFIKINSDMAEGSKNQIELKQSAIPHDSYTATYITALDLCLQGFISPSTLGIDVKKLDNAEAQREKEKATLYTRNAIVSILKERLPVVVQVCLRAYKEFHNQEINGDAEVEIDFGEYANPSFESTVETVSKARTGGVMSIEASVEELYGDSKSDEWKSEEVSRLKNEQGIVEKEEPQINTKLGGFSI